MWRYLMVCGGLVAAAGCGEAMVGRDLGDSGAVGGDAGPGDAARGDAASGDSIAGDAAGNEYPPYPTGVSACQERCELETDCMAHHICRDNRCVLETTEGCTLDLDCWALRSWWSTACSDQSPCLSSKACIQYGDEGVCAMIPTATLECSLLNMQEVDLPVHGDPGTLVTVCADTSQVCTAGECTPYCTSDAGCASDLMPHCNLDTGWCECTLEPEPDSCANPTFGAGPMVCIDYGPHVGRYCGCSEDALCIDFGLGDTCLDGLCICGSSASCSSQIHLHPGTTWVCEAL